MTKLKELSRKNLLNLLLKGQGKEGTGSYIEPNQFLAEWTRDFYTRLILYNPGYEMFSRGVDDRRFDALARLLVGDETCAAVGFNGTNILIATNQANHEEQSIHYRIDFSLIGGSDLVQGIVIQPRLMLFYNNRLIVQLDGDTIQYQYDYIDNSYHNISPINLNFYIDSVDHGIPLLPSINIPFSLISIIPIPSQINPEDFINLISSGYLVNGVNKDVSIEPLARRIDKLFFMPLRLLAKILLEARIDLLQKFEASPNLVQWQESFLHDSLAWETATWYRNEEINPRCFDDNKMTVIREFITLLNDDYLKFKEENDIVIPSTIAVKIWSSTVIAKISTGKIIVPSFIANNPVLFMERALRYFEDIDKLLDFVKKDASENGDFAKILASEVIGSPKTSNIPAIIKDSLPEGTHAELRVLWEAIKNTKKLKYIAISKLCCPLCNLIFKTFGIEHIINLDGENHSGGHGKIYPWILPDEFYSDDDFMTAFLGEDLFALLFSMDGKKFKLNSVEYTIKELVKLIIESLGSFNEVDLEELGIRKRISELLGHNYNSALKLFYKEGDLPYESDDEDAPSYSSNPTSISTKRFIKHPIEGDGNCMFNAILKGASLLGIDVLEDQMALRIKIQEHMRAFPERFNEAITHAVLDMVMVGDIRGISDANFIDALKELLHLKRSLQSANTSIHEVRENILHAVQGMNLAEYYINLIDRDGFWGGEAELGAASEILELRFLVYRNNRVVPISNTGHEAQVIHLRFNGGHYDVLTENPAFNERSNSCFEEKVNHDGKESKCEEGETKVLEVFDEALEAFDNGYNISSDEFAVAITYALSFGIFLSDLNDYL